VSADDSVTQEGINQALEEMGRGDIIRVASGSTPAGIEAVRDGRVHAITYQLPEQDGALPVKVAVDWFNGLEIPPLRHLPVRILDAENINLLVDRRQFVLNADTDLLFQNILDCNSSAVHRFFEQLTEDFSRSIDVSMEFFRGFCIEVFANLHHIMKSANLDEMKIVGNYEGIYKMLFQQPTLAKSLQWLEDTAQAIIRQLAIRRDRHAYLVQQVITFVENHYREPLSLKTLSYEFNITAPYLGKLFRDETGETFTSWLNNLRIEKAVELMKTTDYTVREIALKTGYVNSNYFYRIFKKYMNVNPGEYLTELQSPEGAGNSSDGDQS
jgi:two-component system response regulator YesN